MDYETSTQVKNYLKCSFKLLCLDTSLVQCVPRDVIHCFFYFISVYNYLFLSCAG